MGEEPGREGPVQLGAEQGWSPHSRSPGRDTSAREDDKAKAIDDEIMQAQSAKLAALAPGGGVQTFTNSIGMKFVLHSRR